MQVAASVDVQCFHELRYSPRMDANIKYVGMYIAQDTSIHQ